MKFSQSCDESRAVVRRRAPACWVAARRRALRVGIAALMALNHGKGVTDNADEQLYTNAITTTKFELHTPHVNMN